jgi:hypothetical protein
MRSLLCVTALAFSFMFAGISGADVVWTDTFNGTGTPGTDMTWLAPWPSWTSVGITYYEGTTATFQDGYYTCGTVCTTPSGASEYSHFGSFYFPSASPAAGAMFSCGITIGDEDGYFGVADRSSQTVLIFDQQEGIGQTLIAATPFIIQQETWYNYREEADLSSSMPWVRIKVWETSQTEPVYWTAEGWGIENHPGQYIIIHGGNITANAKIHFDDVGVESQFAPYRATDLAAVAVGSGLELTWTQPTTADSASVYEGTTAYFSPMPGSEVTGLTAGAYTAVGAVGDENTNHFFLVRGVNENGEGTPSNRVGEFDFAFGME